MFGNVISNAEIEDLRTKKALTIEPWEPRNLKLAHYRLTAGRLLRPRLPASAPQAGTREVHDFKESPTFEFAPGEFLIVELAQLLIVPNGVVGNFLPASNVVQRGFGITAGKLDPGFGKVDGKTQHIQFGMKNQLDAPNSWNVHNGLAHVYFVNLTGLRTNAVTFTENEKRTILKDRDDAAFKRANDDGPHYPEEDEY